MQSSPDSYGVDLATGALNLSVSDISAGAPSSGLTHRRYWVGWDQWRDEFDITAVEASGKVTVSGGGASGTFSLGGGGYASDQGDGSTLVKQNYTFVLTASDGTVTTFGHFDYRDGFRATEIRRPDGETLSLTYTFGSFVLDRRPGFAIEPVDMSRLATVTSSSGYRLTYQYANNNPTTTATAKQWLLRSGITLENIRRGGTLGSTTYSYSAFSGARSLTITDNAGRATGYGMDASGRITTITRPGSGGADVTFVYNQIGRISNVYDATGGTSYTYTDGGGLRTTRVTSPNGGVASYVFNIATQKMTSSTDAAGLTTSYLYDAKGRTTRVTESGGPATQYSYDGRGNLVETRTIARAGSGLADAVTSAYYPCATAATCDKPQWVRDPKGSQTDFAYDPATGVTMSITAPADANGVRGVTTFGYSMVNGVQKLTRMATCLSAASCSGSASERVSTIAYDVNNLPTTVTEQAGDGSVVSTTTAGYDVAGNKVSVDGPLAGADDTVYYRYNAAREQVAAITPDPDGAGALVRRASRATYDSRGRVTQEEQGTVSDPSDAGWNGFVSLQQVTRTYDAADRPLTETTSAAGTIYSVTQNSYLGARLDCSAVRMNKSTWGTLPASACTAQAEGSDGPDRITRYGYDAADRVIQVTSGYGTAQAISEATGYTSSGEIASVTDANGNLTTYGYDGFDRLAVTSFPGGSTERLRYDEVGNVDLRTLRDGNMLVYSHDRLNRLVGVVVPNIGGGSSRIYSYDLTGNMTSAVSMNGRTIDMTFDALGRQMSETSNFSTRRFAYDSAGRRSRLTWQDGFFVSYDYLNTGEMSAIRENGGFVLASFGYDNLGRRTAVSRGNGTVTGYGYNPGSQLTGLTHDLAGAGYDNTSSFGYNAAGQIVSRSASNNAYAWNGGMNVDRGYSVNGLNQYTQAGGIGFAYDGRGNLTGSGGISYGYTAENQLTSGAGASLSYDPLGRLDDENGALVLQYDGNNLITEQAAGSNAIMRRYVFGPGADEPIVWYEGSGTGDRRWLAADERGSIVAVTNGAGNATAIDRYDEFGIPGSSNFGRFQYTGQAWLPSIGMYHYKARTYSPTLGRFMQSDPIDYEDGLNLYAYGNNDPINNVDPDGRFADPATTATIVVVGKKLATLTFAKVAPAILVGIGKVLGGIFGGGGSGAAKAQEKIQKQQQQVKSEQQARTSTIRCTGKAYVLRGNSRLIGKEGFTGVKVVNKSAAVIPFQFTGQQRAGPLMRAIGRGARGTLTSATGKTQTFSTFTDRVAHAGLGSAADAQKVIMDRDPGAVVFEIVGGEHFGAGAAFDIVIPNLAGCPVGTGK